MLGLETGVQRLGALRGMTHGSATVPLMLFPYISYPVAYFEAPLFIFLDNVKLVGEIYSEGLAGDVRIH